MLTAQQLINKVKSKKYDGRWLQFNHHKLMMYYGWISIEEFKKLPIPTVVNLLYEIDKMKKKSPKIPKRLYK